MFIGVVPLTGRIQFGKDVCAILWDNTPPMKGISNIRFMNERSFTLLLAFSPFPVERKPRTISSRFATATLEGL